MIKKILFVAFLSLSLLLISACEKEPNPTTATLPDLSGLNKAEVLSELSKLKINFTFNDEVNMEIEPGLFTRYGNDLSIGDKVELSDSIIVFFSASINGVYLPDLSGLDREDIIDLLIEFDIIIQFREYETNDIEEGLFVNYSEPNNVGDIVEYGSTVFINLARKIVEYNSGLIISKYLEGMTTNKAIELTNMSNEAIDLSEYRIDVYLNGSETSSNHVLLNGFLQPGEVYVIVSTGSEQDLIDKADLTTDQFLFDGNDAVAITKEGVVVDIIGNIGWNIFILANETFVRKPEILTNSKSYNLMDWDIYARDYFDVIGSHPVEFPTSFTFNSEQLLIPYTTPGGMTKVTYGYANDGDTSTFSPGFEGDKRVRFIGINTPEMTPTQEPWALEATQSLRGLLQNATDIYVMHDPVYGTVDTYDRSLGLVWADGVLTNYIQVLRGYSISSYSDEDQILVFNGVSLFRWFERAQREAQAEGRGIWSSGS